MNNFTYKSRYGEYEECYFRAGKYVNGNLAIEIWSSEEGPITKVTVNPGMKIPIEMIAVKDYSENEGMVDWLISEEIIEPDLVQFIRSGWVEIPIFRLTEHGKEMIFN